VARRISQASERLSGCGAEPSEAAAGYGRSVTAVTMPRVTEARYCSIELIKRTAPTITEDEEEREHRYG
jgi:hypothetical protein